jgi:hypothetical protein
MFNTVNITQESHDIHFKSLFLNLTDLSICREHSYICIPNIIPEPRPGQSSFRKHYHSRPSSVIGDEYFVVGVSSRLDLSRRQRSLYFERFFNTSRSAQHDLTRVVQNKRDNNR